MNADGEYIERVNVTVDLTPSPDSEKQRQQLAAMGYLPDMHRLLCKINNVDASCFFGLQQEARRILQGIEEAVT